jgi:hypothetical protein
MPFWHNRKIGRFNGTQELWNRIVHTGFQVRDWRESALTSRNRKGGIGVSFDDSIRFAKLRCEAAKLRILKDAGPIAKPTAGRRGTG